MEGEIGMEDTEDITGAEDDDMTEFEQVEGESSHEADSRRGRAAMSLGTEAGWEEFVRPAADEEVPPIPEVPEEFDRPPRAEQFRPVPEPCGAH